MLRPDSPRWSDTDLAIVGLAGRFPGANSPEALWANVAAGVESIRPLTRDELLVAGVDPRQLDDPAYVRAAATLDGVDRFDAGFFGFTPREAAILDPQHRHFLECAWAALEDAGHPPERFGGSIGVYAGCGMNAYFTFNLLTNAELVRDVGLFLLRHTGNDKDFLTTRVSYLLGLTGPSLGIQTACSTSLVAVHVACQQLLGRECDLALAGGVTIEIPHGVGYTYEEGEILSSDGHCRAFDAQANGTVFGSGVGVVALRRMADAVADGDHIYAVIKGSAVNNDGRGKVGYLAPSVDGQAAAVREALSVSGVDVGRIGYIEAHGTGTPVGDPIEIAALTAALRATTDQVGYCALGSIKTNIGHLDTAAGVAGLIKAVKALQHRQLPPSLHFSAPNPAVDFGRTPFYVNTELREWPAPTEGPRLAAVNALGVGGTNAHVIVEEAPARLATSAPGERLLVLSAKTPTALARMRDDLAAAFEYPDAPSVADAAFTLQVGRSRHRHRWSSVCQSRDEAVEVLRAASSAASEACEPPPSVVFMFPGGGVQYPGMGRGLFDREPVFRDAVDQCLAILHDRHGIDLRATLFPDDPRDPRAERALAQSRSSILSIFAIEYALARLMMSWGVVPAAMSGHSLGEYVAACLAGVFTLDDALAIVNARGLIFDRLPPGAMLNVQRSEAEMAAYLDGTLAVAAVNSPVSCVVSGPDAEIAALGHRLVAAGVEHQRLHIDVAAHSPMLEPYLAEFRQAVAAVRLSPPGIPFVSNVSGRWITAAEATEPEYWVRHLRQPVRFADGLATVLAEPHRVLLEVGPGRSLASLALQQPAKPLAILTSMRHPTESLADERAALAVLGRLWQFGVEPDWDAVHRSHPGQRVPLPTYPFERERHWIAPGVGAPSAPATIESGAAAPLDPADWFHVPRWTAMPRPDASAPARVDDIIVFADSTGLAREIAAKLLAGSAGRAIEVEPGPAFARIGTDRFTVRPLSDADHAALFDDLGEGLRSVSHIVYGWTLPGDAGPLEGVDGELDRHFFAPLALAQGLGRRELERTVEVTFLSHGVARIAEETASASAAVVLGVSRVMPREMARVVTRVVDVRHPQAAWQRGLLADLVARELQYAPPAPLVAYRGQTRWVESFVRQRLQDGGLSIRAGGVYVITGGLGSLGLEVATYLARTASARLALVSRTALPPRDSWDGWLAAHGADDTTAVRIRRVRECEALGARVLVIGADVADTAQLERARQAVLDAFGEVHGIVHAAGFLDDGLMALETREAAQAVLRPKVHGTLALGRVFAADAPDFLVLFSSMSAVLGLEGQADYTAASAFLDAYATSTSDPMRTVAVDWGPWRDVGLAAVAARQRRSAGAPTATHPWIGWVTDNPSGDALIGIRLGGRGVWVLEEHVTRGGEAVLPGAAYLELARAVLAERGRSGTVEIGELLLHLPLIAPAGTTPRLEMHLWPADSGFQVSWEVGQDVHATALVWTSEAAAPPSLDAPAIRARCAVHVAEPNGFLDQPFMRFGPRWANVHRIGYGHGEALIDLRLPEDFHSDLDDHPLHPALLDMATAGAQALIPGFDAARDFYVPFAYGHLRMFSGLRAVMVSHVRLSSQSAPDSAVFDVTIADDTGAVLVEVSGFCMRRVSGSAALASAAAGARPTASDLISAGGLADEMLSHGLSVDGGLDAFDRILRSGIGPRVVVSAVSPEHWLDRIAAARPAAGEPIAASGEPADVPTFDPVEAAIASMWHDLLGIGPTALDHEFFALGGQSLAAIRLANRIGRHFQTRVPVSAVFEHPSLGALSALVRDGLGVSTAPSDGAPPDRPALVAVPREAYRRSLADLDSDETTRGR